MPSTPSVTWNGAALDAIRHTRLETPAAAQALFLLHGALFGAWAAYDPNAGGLHWTARRPAAEHDGPAQHAAMAHAAHRVLSALFPARTAGFTGTLHRLGLEVAGASPAPGTPAGVGLLAAEGVLTARSARPQDSAHVHDLPLFALRRPDQFPFAPPVPWGTPAYLEQVREVLAYSAGLTPQHKAVAEFWHGGPGSEGLPGRWTQLAAFVSARDSHAVDQDVKMYLALCGALEDASAACWDAKRQHAALRPGGAVHALLRGRQVRSWAGPGQDDTALPAERWRPYLPTPPGSGHPSAHSTLSAAAAQALCLFTGSDVCGDGVTVAPQDSPIDPRPGPPIRLTWATFSDAADEAGLSRRYGGLHFRDADLAGRAAGRAIGRQAFLYAQHHFNPRLHPAF